MLALRILLFYINLLIFKNQGIFILQIVKSTDFTFYFFFFYIYYGFELHAYFKREGEERERGYTFISN